MRLWFAVGLVVSSIGLVNPAEARDFRVNEIPNGAQFGCLNCHQTNDGKSFTPFGTDVRCHLVGPGPTSMQHVDWVNPNAGGTCGPLFQRDSDGDGYTNGQELADPNGMWAQGKASPSGAHSNPGNPDSVLPPVCNNSKLDPKEECDGSLMSKNDCSEIQLGAGALACTPGCHFDTTACSIAASGSGGDGSNGSTGCAVAARPASSSFGVPASDGTGRVLAFCGLGIAIIVRARRSASRLRSCRTGPEGPRKSKWCHSADTIARQAAASRLLNLQQ